MSDMVELLSTPVKCGGATGITSYISKTLRSNLGSYRRYNAPKTKRISSTRGIQLGRKLDHRFQSFVNKRQWHPSLLCIRKILDKFRIQMLKTQLTVVDAGLNAPHGLKTQLDGVGIIEATQTLVVIELKNTQRTLKDHQATYSVPCSKFKKMRNGHPNCEQSSHFIQTGFGMRALKKTFGIKTKVQGLVIVKCADNKAAFYRVPERYECTSTFSATHTVAPKRPAKLAAAAKINPKCPLFSASVARLVGKCRTTLSKDQCVITLCAPSKPPIVATVATDASERAKTAAKKRLKRVTRKGATRIIFIPCNGRFRAETQLQKTSKHR